MKIISIVLLLSVSACRNSGTEAISVIPEITSNRAVNFAHMQEPKLQCLPIRTGAKLATGEELPDTAVCRIAQGAPLFDVVSGGNVLGAIVPHQEQKPEAPQGPAPTPAPTLPAPMTQPTPEALAPR